MRPELAAQLPELHAALIEQRRFRVDQLAELVTAADHGARREVTEALLAAATAALSDINAALARIQNGRYGSCVQCHEPIAVGRLEILPAAALCMSCQQRAENLPPS
jgi:RNA polymerase-binding transcription factor DksA